MNLPRIHIKCTKGVNLIMTLTRKSTNRHLCFWVCSPACTWKHHVESKRQRYYSVQKQTHKDVQHLGNMTVFIFTVQNCLFFFFFRNNYILIDVAMYFSPNQRSDCDTKWWNMSSHKSAQTHQVPKSENWLWLIRSWFKMSPVKSPN